MKNNTFERIKKMKKEMLVIKEENAILGILPDEMLKNIAGGKIKDTADKE